jgi:hypothetical protein
MSATLPLIRSEQSARTSIPIDSSHRPRHAHRVPSEAPPNRDKDDREREKRRVERLIPELVKRFVETGVEKLADSPETVRQWANELRLPKELLTALLNHVEDAKSEIYKMVVREVREFLERANLADEVTRVLTGVTLEVRTQVRFIPNDAKPPRMRPEATGQVNLNHGVSANVAEADSASKFTDVQEKVT